MNKKIALAFLTLINVFVLCAFDNLAGGENGLEMYGLIMRGIVLALIVLNFATCFWCAFGILNMDPTKE